MPFYPDDAKFGDLKYRDREDLINTLNDDGAWKLVAAYVVKVCRLSRREWIDDIEREAKAHNATYSASQILWDKLKSLNCDLHTLREILKACELFDAESIIAPPEDLEIIEEPNPNDDETSREVAIGETFSITCRAKGLPPPKYQWFHGNVELDGETSTTFSRLIESPDQEGEYYCKIRQFSRDGELLQHEYSNYVDLVVKSTPVEITKQPVSVKVPLGKDCTLSCEAKGHPSPTYQWYKGNHQLDGENRSTLHIRGFDPLLHADQYHCVVSNASGPEPTVKVKVKEDHPPQKATIKVALIIANSDYENYNKLSLAVDDGAAIARRLREIGFHVICLQNLTLKEMRTAVKKFCELLIPGSYGFFYFAGHGFMMDDFYMMPVDMPEREKSCMKDAYPQDEFLSHALKKESALLVVLPDMCLTVPDKNDYPEIYAENPKKYKYGNYDNLYLAYSTCTFNESYENRNARNGVYASELIKQITLKKNVNKLFNDVASAVRRLSAQTKTLSDQKPMVTHLPQAFYRCLTDAATCEESSIEYQNLKKLTSFRGKKVKIQFTKCQVICNVFVDFPNPPYMNVMLLRTSGLEQWEVSFDNYTEKQLKLQQKNRTCSIHNPQRITPGEEKKSLAIRIGKNGTVHDSVYFPYLNYVPKAVSALHDQQ